MKRLAQEAVDNRPTTKRDTAADDFIALMYDTRVQVSQTWSDEDVERLAQIYGVKTNDYNRMQQIKMLKRVVGVDVFVEEPWLREAMRDFTLANVKLIKSATEETFSKIENKVLGGFQRGMRHETLIGYIDKQLGVGESHARLIARDQINKLNGQLSMLRQTNLGIKQFIWRTSMDDRVRESHAEMEGEICDWDDLPDVDGENVAPGEPIQCRCWPEPVFEAPSEEGEDEVQ